MGKPARSRTSLAAALLLLTVAGHAQTRRAMTLVDLASVPRVLDPQLSPDGGVVLYALTRADWKADRQIPHIWRQDVGGGSPVQLTFGDGGETTPRWSPDGRTITFLTRRAGDTDTQVYAMPLAGGEPRRLTTHATSVTSPAWSPDGRSIYFVAAEPRTAAERERDRLKDDVYAFEENYKQRQLWTVDVATGAERQLTSGDSSVVAFRVAADGRHVVLHRAPTPLTADAYRSEVWLMDAAGANARQLTDNAIEENEAELSPDGTVVLFLADANAQLAPYFNTTLFVVPASGGAPRAVLGDFRYAVDHATWAPDGKSILAVVNMGVHSELFRIELNGQTKQLTDGRHSVQFWSVAARAGRMVFQLDEPARPGDVWTLPIGGGTATRVTSVYDALDRDFLLPRQEKIEWTSSDGVPIEGVLFYPSNYERGRRYPLVVQLHGGPGESDKFGAGPGFIVNYVPVLTARGYAVLRPNYRGSSGYGNAFYRDVVGEYFAHQHLDVLAGVDFLVAQGIADPDRLVVMGWSAGAHLTNKLITYTDRFRAASAAAGVAEWTSMFAQTDTRATRAVWFGGTPWQKNAPIGTYWGQSPLKEVSRVTTPTMFVVGEDDARVPMPQSVEMYRALTANGVPTRLYVAPREGHQWGELRHQLAKANAELEWFERYARRQAYVWELAPSDADADSHGSGRQ